MKTVLSNCCCLLASLAIAGAANEVIVQPDTMLYVTPGTPVALPAGATVKGAFYNPAGVTLGTGAWLATVDAGRLVQQAVAGDAVVVLAVGGSTANPLTVTNRSGTADTFSVKVADSVADKPGWMKAVNRTWTLDKAQANASNGVDLLAAWNADEEDASLGSDLLLYQWDGSHWISVTTANALVSGRTLSQTQVTGALVEQPFIVGSRYPAPTLVTPAGTSNQLRPAFSGTATANSTVTVNLNGEVLGTTSASAGGTWSLTPTTDLVDGTQTLTAQAADGLGNVSALTEEATYNLDSTLPTAAADTLDRASQGVTKIAVAQLLANDSDPLGRPLTLSSVSALSGGVVSLSGRWITFTPDSGLATPLAIPDDDATGILRALTVSGLDTDTAYAVSVTMNVSSTGYGGFVGDIYAYLAHQAPDGSYTLTVLLNRPGRSDLLLSGYDDAGLDIVLSDDAAHDVHTYQSQAYQLSSSGALTGSWQPDRRLADPDTVTDASERSAILLASIVNGDPNGSWYCFIADMETGGTLQLSGWSVSLTAVPEPATAQVLGVLFASALLVRRRKNGACGRAQSDVMRRARPLPA